MGCSEAAKDRFSAAPWAAVAFALLACAGARAESTALADYFQQTWGTADGLPHNQVQDIAQTADGYLWLASWEGATRFNGHEFEIIDESIVPDLEERGTTDLAVTAGGELLVATARGELLRRSGSRWTRVPAAPGTRELPIYDVTGHGGTVYLGSAGRGLWQVEGAGTMSPVPGAELLAGRIVYALLPRADGLWIGSDAGLFRLRALHLDPVGERLGLKAGSVLSLAEGDEGGVVIGTEHGAYRVHGERLGSIPGLPEDSFESLLRDRQGNLWLGSASHGLFRVGSRGVEQLDSSAGLPSDRVVSLFEDAEGSIWVGTSRGLFRLRDAPFVAITRRQGLQDVYTRSLLEDPSGDLLAATSGGLARIRRGADGDRVVETLVPDQSVLSAVRSADGALWLGTYYAGLLRWVDGRVQRKLGREQGLPSSQVRSLLAEPDGRLWVGTSRGLARLDGERIDVFGAAEGLPSESVLSLLRDRGGRLWVGTGAGLAAEKDGRFVVVDAPELAGAQRMYGLSEDGEGALLLAHDRGIARHVDGRWSRLTAREGLPLGAIFAVLADRAGDLWLSSNRGILRIERDEARRVFAGEARLRRWELFDESDGLPSAQSNGAAGHPALLDATGVLWFATAGGVARIDPAALAGRVDARPLPRLEAIRVDGVLLERGDPLQLPPGTQRLQLRYVGLNFLNPRKVRYRYRMDGFDPDWIEVGGERSAQFTNLPPGEYRFRVEAANPFGDWSGEGESLAVTVHPHWWQRGGLQAAALAALALLLMAGMRWRLRAHEQQRRALQQRIEQATRALQQQAVLLQERNAELDAYAHSVAHDLKNPLATVIGMSTLLQNLGSGMGDAQRLDMNARIRAAGEKMVEIIDALLLLGHARSDAEVPLGPVELSASVQDALRALTDRILASGASIEVQPDLPAVEGYAPWIDRVLSNYMGNAIKYGGDPPRIEIAARQLDDGSVELWVKDSGAGLTEEAQRRLFQPFYRAGNVGGDGHGIGLSIVRRVVERMGGSVGCDSAPGEGARFWFRLRAAGSASSRGES